MLSRHQGAGIPEPVSLVKGGEGAGEGEWFRYILREGTRKMEEAKARTFRTGDVEDGKTRFFFVMCSCN